MRKGNKFIFVVSVITTVLKVSARLWVIPLLEDIFLGGGGEGVKQKEVPDSRVFFFLKSAEKN